MTETFIVGRNTTIYEYVVILKADHEITIGNDCLIGQFAFIGPRKLVMKDKSQIAPGARLSGGGEVYMGYKSAIGFNANIICATDTPEAQFMVEAGEPSERRVIRGSITIEEGASVESGAIVCVSRRCKDIVIGKYTVIGAGAYIDRSVPANRKIVPIQKYTVTTRFVCAIDRSRECAMEDCSIHGVNWAKCGYLNRPKGLTPEQKKAI